MPSFLGEGDCELIEELKPVLTAAFAFRDLEYRTGCVPHAIEPNSFSVKAQVLKVAAPSKP